MAQISIQSACFVLFIFISITSLAVSKSIDNKKWSENGELLQVHVLMRHGARTPLSSYDVITYTQLLIHLKIVCYILDRSIQRLRVS